MQIELDEKFGCSWHVVVGEDFGFDMTFEVLHIPHFPFVKFKNCYHLSERSHDVHFLRVPWRSPLEVRHSVVKGNHISSQMAMTQLQRSI